jgi:hypothetical protein
MLSYSQRDIILVRYLFSDLSNAKVRPAVVVGVAHSSQDRKLLVNKVPGKRAVLRG